MNIELATVNAGNSDHNPVMSYINGETDAKRTTAFRKICFPKFTDITENSITCFPPLSTVHELELTVANATQCIQDAMESASRTTDRPAAKTIIPEEIKELIRKKNQARRAWQRHTDVAARANMNLLARQVKDALQEFRNERWSATLEQLEMEEQSPWRITRAVRQKRKSVPPIHSPAGLVYNDEDKAEAFADRLELQTSLNSELGDIAHMKYVENCTRTMLNKIDRSKPRHVTPVEISELIKKLSVKKAPGPDNIPNAALKNLGRKGTYMARQYHGNNNQGPQRIWFPVPNDGPSQQIEHAEQTTAVPRNNPADINLRSTDMGLCRGPSDKATTDCVEYSTAQSNRRAMLCEKH
ncbi:hypothetical protein CBL_05098 [Carabus blaptoides fortunei]